ncbi:MAG: hypothetical protein ACOYEO_06525, partial [bacterium]
MLPPTIVPMQPALVREPFDNPDYTFQVKWDGIRLLSFVEQGKVRLQTRRLRDRTGFYPELLILPKLSREDKVVLDGEAIILGRKGPSFPTVLRREQVATERQALALAKEIPICYMVFDLLFVGGRSLLDRPLMERQQRLHEILREDSVVQVVEDFPSGTELFAAVEKAELEGIVAKKKSSHYITGAKTKLWQKIKVRRQQLCVVGGYLLSGSRLRSLMVGAWQDDRLVYLGRVGTGLTWEEAALLEQALPKLATSACPFSPVARVPGSKWVSPVLP